MIVKARQCRSLQSDVNSPFKQNKTKKKRGKKKGKEKKEKENKTSTL